MPTADVPLSDVDLDGLFYHGCSSGTPTPSMVRDMIVRACVELQTRRRMERDANSPMRRQVFYVAHPLAGDLAKNLANAKVWLRWLRTTFPETTFIAPWISSIDSGADDNDPNAREQGLLDACAVLGLIDGIVLCSGLYSSGMQREELYTQAMRKAVYDLGKLGWTPPAMPAPRASELVLTFYGFAAHYGYIRENRFMPGPELETNEVKTIHVPKDGTIEIRKDLVDFTLTKDSIIDGAGYRVKVINGEYFPEDLEKMKGAPVDNEVDLEELRKQVEKHTGDKGTKDSPHEVHGRKRLLARMAGNIAAGFVNELRLGPIADTTGVQNETQQRIAENALGIAERILKEVGL